MGVVGSSAVLEGDDLVVLDSKSDPVASIKLADPVAGETFSVVYDPDLGTDVTVNPVPISTSWSSAGDGDWGTAANWTGAGVPNDPTTNVTLGTLANSYTVTIGAAESFSVGTLTVSIQSGKLLVAGSLAVANTVSIEDGTLDLGATDQTFAATSFSQVGGEIAGTGTLTLDGTAVLTSGWRNRCRYDRHQRPNVYHQYL